MPLKKALPAPPPADERAGSTDAADPLAQLALLAQLPDRAEREHILLALIRAPSPALIEGMLALLPAASIRLRNELIDALRDMGAAAVPQALQLLRSADANLRIYALSIVEDAADPALPERLAVLLETEPEVNVAAMAVELLGNVGDRRHRALLQRVAQRFAEQAYLQGVVQQALARSGGDA